ncbi:rhodopsin, GQ-coupled-like [Symsagittifera roscoffensis]|uniref:rhodopsin, GQ-coupled-like n=1 Tax=Symsagittifera roscoffensis TaxID=84072 RepID=UPI00307B7D62
MSVYGNHSILDLSSSLVPNLDVEEVDDSWKESFYEPLPDWVHNVIGVLLVINIYLGFHGNGITIHIFLSTKSLRTPQNLFLVNLAVVDFIMVMACQPEFCISSFLRYHPFGSCYIFGTVATFGGLCSINSMAAIAYDRYIMICSPPEKMTTPTMKRSLSIIACVWAYNLIFAILPNVGIGGFYLNGCGTCCTFDFISRSWYNRANLFLMYVFGFLFPLIICIYCYLQVFLTVKGSGAANKNDAKGHSKGKEVLVAKVSMVCIGVYVLTWLPYATLGLSGQFVEPQHLKPYVTTWPALIAKTNCIYNPIIYALGHPSFKKELKRRLTGP